MQVLTTAKAIYSKTSEEGIPSDTFTHGYARIYHPIERSQNWLQPAIVITQRCYDPTFEYTFSLLQKRKTVFKSFIKIKRKSLLQRDFNCLTSYYYLGNFKQSTKHNK